MSSSEVFRVIFTFGGKFWFGHPWWYIDHFLRIDAKRATDNFDDKQYKGFNSIEQAAHYYYDPSAVNHDKKLLPAFPPGQIRPDAFPIPPPSVPIYYSDYQANPEPPPKNTSLLRIPHEDAPEQLRQTIYLIAREAQVYGQRYQDVVDAYFLAQDRRMTGLANNFANNLNVNSTPGSPRNARALNASPVRRQGRATPARRQGNQNVPTVPEFTVIHKACKFSFVFQHSILDTKIYVDPGRSSIMIPAGYYCAHFAATRGPIHTQVVDPDLSVDGEEDESTVADEEEEMWEPPRVRRNPVVFTLTRLYDASGRIDEETFGDILEVTARQFDRVLSEWNGGGLLKEYLRRRYCQETANQILEFLQRARRSPTHDQILGLSGLGMAVNEAEIILLLLKTQSILSHHQSLELFNN